MTRGRHARAVAGDRPSTRTRRQTVSLLAA
jgi:hypothetical protein